MQSETKPTMDDLVNDMLEKAWPFIAHVKTVQTAFPRDPVSAGEVCRNSVSFSDFEKLSASYENLANFVKNKQKMNDEYKKLASAMEQVEVQS